MDSIIQETAESENKKNKWLNRGMSKSLHNL